MKYGQIYLVIGLINSVNSFGEGLYVTDVHFYVKVLRCRFNVKL